MKIKTLFTILLGCSRFSGLSQENLKPLSYDDAPVSSRSFGTDLKEKYAGNSFNYEETTGSGENLITGLVGDFLAWLSEIFGITMSPSTYEAVETLFYIIIIGGSLYLIIKLLMGQQAHAVFGGKNTSLGPVLGREEDLNQIDLQTRIEEALKQGNYRLTVRYMFLKTLKELSSKRLIEWHFEKTNRDYLDELQSNELKNEFKTVSRLYDYIWYGEFPIDKERFQKAAQQFEQLQKSINRYG